MGTHTHSNLCTRWNAPATTAASPATSPRHALRPAPPCATTATRAATCRATALTSARLAHATTAASRATSRVTALRLAQRKGRLVCPQRKGDAQCLDSRLSLVALALFFRPLALFPSSHQGRQPHTHKSTPSKNRGLSSGGYPHPMILPCMTCLLRVTPSSSRTQKIRSSPCAKKKKKPPPFEKKKKKKKKS